MDQKAHKRAISAWTMYDWANSAFATTIMAAVLPVYYTSVATAGLAPNIATAYWGYTSSFSALLAAIISPILGAVADFSGSKKKFLTAFMALGVTGTALLYFIQSGDWLLASLFFTFGNIGFAGSLVYYDALLPHVAGPEEIDQVSSRGYAMGYIGGGLLLAINLVMIMVLPGLIPGLDTGLMTRLSFVTVAVWWAVFTLPLLLHVKEPQRRIHPGEENYQPIQASFHRLGQTFRELGKYRDLAMAMLAFWVYANGIGTIIVMATAYGNELGFGKTTLIGTLLMVQFLAAPFAILFGRLSRKIGTKKSIYISLAIYTLIAIAGFFLYHEWQFWALGAAVATVQGGSQALSRSLIGRLMPKSKSAEFYGFFSVFEKFASILGPFLFGVVSTIVGHSRLSILSLFVFFLVGMLLLTRVDVERGMKAAQEEEQEMVDRQANPGVA
ncbi:permease of the major facilitator superfamily [Longilinea arvoryzae]|uniref:Permease of the major facilitator superfamily n=1 Tax=Longilinea arvoryzae TaxID=360412 RepID=A0A0S7BF14_9CHLR|nr:MFS transporter [Longilinea arvoryzae]GAP14173.1 permease of the major facilitator superfamily [Longilinea arvoryzae]